MPALKTWLKKPQDRFTSLAIHNEILETHCQRTCVCLRYVDGPLNAQEYFIGFDSLDSINANSIVHTIEDILLRLSLQLHCKNEIVISTNKFVRRDALFLCAYIIIVHVTQFFLLYSQKSVTFTKTHVVFIENNASLLTNLLVKITISFLQ